MATISAANEYGSIRPMRHDQDLQHTARPPGSLTLQLPDCRSSIEPSADKEPQIARAVIDRRIAVKTDIVPTQEPSMPNRPARARSRCRRPVC
jgi:hypothetical protein